MKRIAKTFVALILAVLAAAPSAKAGIHEIVYAYENRGWFVHDIAVESLYEKDGVSKEVYLNAGDRMVLRGEGADAVRDLDLAVFLPNGNLLKRDADRDPHPCVIFTAPVSGHYTVEATLFELWSGFETAEVAVILAEQ